MMTIYIKNKKMALVSKWRINQTDRELEQKQVPMNNDGLCWDMTDRDSETQNAPR